MPTLFTHTDQDGDTITVEQTPDGNTLLTVSGEDGHRSAYINGIDTDKLIAAING